jgi:hypothetical protein
MAVFARKRLTAKVGLSFMEQKCFGGLIERTIGVPMECAMGRGQSISPIFRCLRQWRDMLLRAIV